MGFRFKIQVWDSFWGDPFDPNAHIIELADGSKAKVVTGNGVAKVKLYDVNGSSHDLILNNALYVPIVSAGYLFSQCSNRRGRKHKPTIACKNY